MAWSRRASRSRSTAPTTGRKTPAGVEVNSAPALIQRRESADTGPMISRMIVTLVESMLDVLFAPMIAAGALTVRALQAHEPAIEALWLEQDGE